MSRTPGQARVVNLSDDGDALATGAGAELRPWRIPALVPGPIVVALLALLCAQAAAASFVYPLPRADYGVREVCGTPGLRRAACQAFQLVPLSAEARARRHPLGITRRTSLRAASPAEGAFGLRPQDLHSVYKLPTSASSAQTVALVNAYNDPTAESDLKAYDEEFGLPECTSANGCFKQVNQNGETANLPFPKTTKELESAKKGSRTQKEEAEEANGWGVEISLDIETAHATCQSCSILLVEATIPTYEDLEKGEKSAETLGATEISNSWAGSEAGETPTLENASPFNHPGTVITAAAGDDGYLNWDSSEKGHVNFPASSPHVVAVGGTRLSLGVNGEWTGEVVWNGDHATGGGCSVEFTAQSWQQAVSDWASVGCSTKRAVADVAADADPYTGLAVHYTSSECEEAKVHWCTIGGTSLSSPLIASVFALAGGADGVAYPTQSLYEDAVKSPGSLHDITLGSNGECKKGFVNGKLFEGGVSNCTTAEEAASCSSKAICLASTGYDGPTGVGTPDGAADFSATPTIQSPPSVVTGSVSGVSQSGATLAGSVNPNGGSVSSCVIEYGTSLPSVTSVSCSPSPGGGTSAVSVSALAGGLSADTTYEYRVVATNAGGTSTGSPESFTTLPNPPTVVTGAASGVSQTSATLNATVNPNGAEVSECELEYGTTVSYGHSAPCSPSPGSGHSPVAVSASLTGLTSNTTYHFRIVATNPGGTSKGTDETFKTPPNPPTVTTETASSITQTTATLNATVNPNGAEISECKFEYGAAALYELTKSYESSVPCSSLPLSGDTPVEVSAPVMGLTASTAYDFRVSATNAAGTSKGEDQTFTTQAAPAQVPPEFGRCVKVPAEKEGKKTVYHGGFTTATCLVASETHTGHYEWYPGVLSASFKTALTSKSVKLESAVKTATVTCTGETSVGEYAGRTTVTGVVLTLTGCTRGAAACSSSGAAEREIITNALEGVLGVVELGATSAADKLGLELYPVGKTGPLMEFSCAGATVSVRGSVIVPVTANRMSLTQALTFKASKGKQKPESFVEGPQAILEESVDAAPFEQTGLALAMTQTSEEKVEVNSVV